MNQEKNINTQAAAEVMTTDEFCRQLVENTEAINKEREDFERKKIQLQQECDCQKSLADSILKSIQRERQELELEFSSKKSSLNDRERNTHESRRKATELYLTGMAEAKGVHALKNQELQNQRHKIFEAYRNSGGANLAEDSQQMYPEGWSRPKPKDGGVSDEE